MFPARFGQRTTQSADEGWNDPQLGFARVPGAVHCGEMCQCDTEANAHVASNQVIALWEVLLTDFYTTFFLNEMRSRIFGKNEQTASVRWQQRNHNHREVPFSQELHSHEGFWEFAEILHVLIPFHTGQETNKTPTDIWLLP